jgi:exonuclease-1
MEVRVGYFGICMGPVSGGDNFVCSSNATALSSLLRPDQDPLNLIWVASTFKDAVVFPYLM